MTIAKINLLNAKIKVKKVHLYLKKNSQSWLFFFVSFIQLSSHAWLTVCR